jgi:hypothetical protein
MLRSDLWVAAFVRRHNDIGHICVVARKGDAGAGQVFIEIDHLDGTVSLLTPAATSAEGTGEKGFVRRFAHASPQTVTQRIAREAEFDPDFWLIALEMRGDDPGVPISAG